MPPVETDPAEERASRHDSEHDGGSLLGNTPNEVVTGGNSGHDPVSDTDSSGQPETTRCQAQTPEEDMTEATDPVVRGRTSELVA